MIAGSRVGNAGRALFGSVVVWAVASCTAGTSTKPPTPGGPALEAQVGAQGATLMVPGTNASLEFPAGALAVATTVRVTTLSAENGEGDLRLESPLLEIELDPAPTDALPVPATLRFSQVSNVAEARVARLLPSLGSAIEGSPPQGLWLPLEQSAVDASGRLAVRLPRFSRYGVVRGRRTACVPPADLLAPPATPDGFRYVGVEVAVNHVYDTARSTVPLSRSHRATDRLVVRSRTRVASGVVVCDFVVVHRFEPIAAPAPVCEVPADMLAPPATPDGYRYLGRTVVINFVLDGALTTAPIERAPQASDLTTVRSRTVVRDGVTVCDVIVAHEFERIQSDGGTDAGAPDAGPDGGTCTGATCAACVVPLAFKTPPATPRGYRYVGYSIAIDRMVIDTTIPLGRPLSPTDLTVIRARTLVENFVTVCDVVVEHLFEPIPNDGDGGTADGGGGGCVGAACQQCVVPEALLAPPPTPDGYRYVGRTVVVNMQTVETTVPLGRRDSRTDHTAIRSHTIVRDGVTVCDILVGHTFEPIGAVPTGGALPGGCAGAPAGTGCGAGKACSGAGTCETCVPPAAWLAPPPTPDGYRYVGVTVVINFVLTETTVDLERPLFETDLTVIRSSTLVRDFTTVCDIIVAHTFEPISSAAMCAGRPDGASCNDNDACTRTDTCQSGVCVGGNPIVCTAQSQCHAVGTCDPTTGQCSNPLRPEESPCNDDNACTQSDVCRKGICVGTNAQLGLDSCLTPHPFLWVAEPNRGTVAKINTVNGTTVARYRSSPGGGDPSRTTVDHAGDVWISHRNTPEGQSATAVTKIGLAEAGSCVDRNGNGIIDTSSGPNDVRPWTGTWGGGVAGAEDECVLAHVELQHPNATTPTDVRALAVDRDNNVFAGGLSSPGIFKIRTDGVITAANDTTHVHGEAVVASDGTLWSAPLGSPMLQAIDRSTLAGTTVTTPSSADVLCGVSVLNLMVLSSQLTAFQIAMGTQLRPLTLTAPTEANPRVSGCAEAGLPAERSFYYLTDARVFWQPVAQNVIEPGLQSVDLAPGQTGLSVDQQGFLWTSGAGGLTRVNPATRVVVNFPLQFPIAPITTASTGYALHQVGAGCARRPNGAPCSDGNACTVNDSCQSGVCVGGVTHAAEGSSCGDGRVCEAGSCVACVEGDGCTPANPCQTGQYFCSGGVRTCVGTGNRPNLSLCGTPSSGQVCVNGECSPCQVATCQPAEYCRKGVVSGCGTATPTCLETGNQDNGLICATGKVCNEGNCVDCAAGASCTPANPCEEGVGECGTGMFFCRGTNRYAADGTTCGADKVCNGGSCVPCAAGAACTPSNPCRVGVIECGSGTPQCVETGDQTDGTPCNDGESCSHPDTCQSGVCAGVSLPELSSCANGLYCCGAACRCAQEVIAGPGFNAGTVVNGEVGAAGLSPPSNPQVTTPIIWLAGHQQGNTAVVRINTTNGMPLGPPTNLPGNAANPSRGAVALDGSFLVAHSSATNTNAGAVSRIRPDGSVACTASTEGAAPLPLFGSLSIDRAGRAWVGSVTDTSVRRVELFEASCKGFVGRTPLMDEAGSVRPDQMVVDRAGSLWITSPDRAFRGSTATGTLQAFGETNPTTGITVSKNQNVWMGRPNAPALRRYPLPSGAPVDMPWPRVQMNPSLGSYGTRALAVDGAGDVIALVAPPTPDAVFISKFNGQTGQYVGSVRLNQMNNAFGLSVDANNNVWVTGTLAQGGSGFARRSAAIGADNTGGNPGDDQWDFVNPLPGIDLTGTGGDLTGLTLRTGTLDNGQLTTWTLSRDYTLAQPEYLRFSLTAAPVSFDVWLVALAGREIGPFATSPVDLRPHALLPGMYNLHIRMTTESSSAPSVSEFGIYSDASP